MRFFVLGIFVPMLGLAAILPETIGPFHRASTTPVATAADKALWDEYGLKEAERAGYENGAEKFTATVYRLVDSTAALGAFDWQRPPKSTASNAARLAAETEDGLMVVYGNYLLWFDGRKPDKAELDAVTQSLKSVDTTALPSLTGYLPVQDLVPNTERYIIGPVGLQKFAGAIPPSVAAFRFSAEAQVGVFHSPKGDQTMAIFNYPTPQIAMLQMEELGKIPGVVAKRSGPLVAVVLSPPDPDFAERLLAGVRYQAQVTRDEYVPTKRDNVGNLLLNACILIGILLAFSLVSGLAFGGLRAFMKRGKKGEEADAMITLHLR